MHAFIKKFKPLAVELSAEFDIPVSIILGVSIIESGSGKSKNCRLLNNYFGIVGKNSLRHSKGSTYHSMFKEYPNAEASFRDFCRKMSKKKFYAKLKGNNDYHDWVAAMSKSGYSQYPALWRKNVLSVIKQYKLAPVSKKEDEQQPAESPTEQPAELPVKDTTVDTIP
ncbi:MAG: glucosaminidase domain-containing protein [Bacteroidota bacterium]